MALLSPFWQSVSWSLSPLNKIFNQDLHHSQLFSVWPFSQLLNLSITLSTSKNTLACSVSDIYPFWPLWCSQKSEFSFVNHVPSTASSCPQTTSESFLFPSCWDLCFPSLISSGRYSGPCPLYLPWVHQLVDTLYLNLPFLCDSWSILEGNCLTRL